MANYITYGSSFGSVPFHPSQLAGGQLYLRKDQATVSSWVSDIGTARNFSQGVAGKQPIISTNSVDFDGINEIQGLSESHPFGADTQGSMFISGYFDNSALNIMLSTTDASANNEFSYFGINTDGKLRMTFNNSNSGGSSNIIDGTIVIPNGSYYYIRFTGNGIGNPYTFSVNGVTDTLVATAGTNNSKWFDSLLTTDRLSLAALIRPSNFFSPVSINKIYYNNTVLTSGEISNMDTFMSDPTKY